MKLLLTTLLLWTALLAPPVRSDQANMLIVSEDGPYFDIPSALDVASTGDVIEVHGGVYTGALVVEKSVVLRGQDWPVLDGDGRGTVVSLQAENIVFEGFIVRNSGALLDEENSGIAGEAPGLVIQDNRLEETLFGIYLREAPGSIIRRNQISSKDLDVPRRGDPIRVWFSHGVTIEENQVLRGRDVVLWYSNDLTVLSNEISEGRYGLHFMYCDDALIKDNRLSSNSVGAFLMYSRRMHLIHNTIAFNRGPSGYGIGLKDMDDAVVRDNLFLDNRIGAHLDNSPREVDSLGLFEGNVFAFNTIGVELMPSTRNNLFTGNSFMDNQEQVAVAGGGLLKNNTWTVDGQGNFWSDYAGYDENLDGIGDHPYHAERLFEDMIDRFPDLRLFIFSPSADAVDFAARAVPLVKPQPKLTDSAPLMAPAIPADLPALPLPTPGSLSLYSTGLLLVAATLLWFGRRELPLAKKNIASAIEGGQMIEISNLHKRFGEVVAVDDLSLRIEPGQAVAIWGSNGAGKTTVLRSLLGVIPFEGRITISGINVRSHAKAARRLVGFVPQELSFHDDMTVLETINFYAGLKKIQHMDPDDESHQGPIPGLLERHGLSLHMAKQVGALSGGMKQRLALAIALLADPPILILDEPTSNLDVHGRDDLMELLVALKAAGKTLIFSSHRVDEVIRLADRVLLMQSARLVSDISPGELADHAGWRAMIRLAVPAEAVQPALETLQAEGFQASPNGKGIWVQADPLQKARPIEALVQAGIPVADFDIERENEEVPRD
jgi:nitrous oxidase accessory protein